MNNLISVIVPVYNIETLVERAVRSILEQTYRNIEVIAVDDGSTDNSLAVLEGISKDDKRIHIIHKENGGVTSARLRGVSASRGDWIGFVDGDDEIEPQMYERLLSNALLYEADISHCGYQMVFPSRIDYYYGTGIIKKLNKEEGLKELIEGTLIEPGLWNKLFRKDLFFELQEKQLMDQSIKYTEDFLMNFYLFREATSSIYEDVCPYHYLVRKGSAATSGLSEQYLLDPLRVLKTIKKETINDQELQHSINMRLSAKLISLSSLRLKNDMSFVRPLQEKARNELREMIPVILFGKYTLRIKTMTIWAAIWPWSYGYIRHIYAIFRGIDKKYDVS